MPTEIYGFDPGEERERKPGLRKETLEAILKGAKKGIKPYAMEAEAMATELLELRELLNRPEPAPMVEGDSVSPGTHLFIEPFDPSVYATLSTAQKVTAASMAKSLLNAFDWSITYPGIRFWDMVHRSLLKEARR